MDVVGRFVIQINMKNIPSLFSMQFLFLLSIIILFSFNLLEQTTDTWLINYFLQGFLCYIIA